MILTALSISLILAPLSAGTSQFNQPTEFQTAPPVAANRFSITAEKRAIYEYESRLFDAANRFYLADEIESVKELLFKEDVNCWVYFYNSAVQLANCVAALESKHNAISTAASRTSATDPEKWLDIILHKSANQPTVGEQIALWTQAYRENNPHIISNRVMNSQAVPFLAMAFEHNSQPICLRWVTKAEEIDPLSLEVQCFKLTTLRSLGLNKQAAELARTLSVNPGIAKRTQSTYRNLAAKLDQRSSSAK